MRIILAEYLEHGGRSVPTDALAHAAQGASNGGQKGTCMTVAYVQASESFEGFLDLMRRLDSSSSSPPYNGRARAERGPGPSREGTRVEPPPTDWGTTPAAGDRPSSRRSTRDPARENVLPFHGAKPETAVQPRENCGLPLSRCHSRAAGTDGRRGEGPSWLEPSEPSALPPSGRVTTAGPVGPAATPSSAPCPPSHERDPGAFDGRWLHARGWPAEVEGSADWVSVPATPTAAGPAGGVGGAGLDQMDRSGTFRTDDVRK